MRLLTCALLVATCAHCGPEPEQPFVCRTRCGVVYTNWPTPTNGWSCDRAQQMEDFMLADFTQANDARFQSTCGLIADWKVTFVPGDSFTDPSYKEGKGHLLGLTDCWGTSTKLSNLPPDQSAMPHEMAHAVQYCQANKCAYTDQDKAHFCWDTNMIYQAIDQVSADLALNPVPPRYP